MKNILSVTVIFAAILMFSGCAHKIDMAPNLDTIRTTQVEPFKLNVAYYISDSDKQLEVITPGGGGDNVKYTPYADTEAALNAVLQNAFSKAYFLKSLEDKAFIANKNISYIFQPKIVTSSSSENMFTWPPERFVVELTCTALDPLSKSSLWEITTNGAGTADFGDYRKDFSAAARKASEDAFLKMLIELSKTKMIERK